MNFEFSEEQNLLRDQAASFLATKSPLAVARRVLEGDESYDAGLWNQIAQLGWTATTIPDSYQGAGLGYLELCVMAEELGRMLTPVPFSSSVYLASPALLQFGSEAQKEAWLPRLALGKAIGCLAIAEGVGEVSPANISLTERQGKLTGEKILVPDGDFADVAVVIARSGSTHSLFLVDLRQAGVSRQLTPTIDPSRSHANIRFAGVATELLGQAGAGIQQLEQILDRAAVLFAFEQVGGAEAAMNQARDYALHRYAFGRPIAGFQAIKHKLARMYVAIQLARSNCYYGAWALSTQAKDLGVAAATARISAIAAFRECAEENIQIHGGMGFTWEFDCHLYYRRARLLAANLGGEVAWKHRLMSRIQQQRTTA